MGGETSRGDINDIRSEKEKWAEFDKWDEELLGDRRNRPSHEISLSLEEASQRLQKMAEIMGYQFEIPAEFPSGLETNKKGSRTETVHYYAGPDSFQDSPDSFRVLRKDHITAVVRLRRDDMLAADIYVNGKLEGGNHDFGIHELHSVLTHSM